ncbi:hypothetical protein IIA28_21305 [candidate division KSB1 bacterium]|nr:hypothetical protein [candidate division KSB1 bacterium]
MKKTFILVVVAKLIFFATMLPGQSIPLEQCPGISMSVEFLKPYFVSSNSNFATTVLFFTGRLSLSQTIIIVGDLPLAHHGYKDVFGLEGFESSTIMGNPYLGVEIQKQAFPVFAELGFRLPLGTDRFKEDVHDPESRATGVARIADPDRFEAFRLYDLTVTARLNYRRKLGSDFQLHLRGGWSGGGSNREYGPGDFQTLDYSVQLGYQIEQVSIIGGLTGRYLLDGSTFHLSRHNPRRGRTAHQIAVAASMGFGAVRPGVHFRVPVDDYLNGKLRFILGFNLVIKLK